MSFWYGEINVPNPQSMGGGEAPLLDIWSAGTEQMRYVDNSNAADRALYRAYDERIAKIRERTGESRDNPLEVAARRQGGDEAASAFTFSATPRHKRKVVDYRGEEVQSFNAWMAELERKYPDAGDIIRAGVPVDRDAEALARQADAQLAQAMQSREGVMPWLASMGGALQGSLYDPLQVATLFLGGGAGGARTVAGRIVSTAMTEAAVNAGTEAVLQPAVQDWRRRAGLPSGVQQALENIGFAGLAGGVLGGGARAIGEAASAIAGRVRMPERAAAVTPVERAVEVMRPRRAELSPELRGAVDAAEMIDHQARIRPAAIAPDLHDVNLDKATDAAMRGAPYRPEIDTAQVDRIVAQLVPETAAPVADAAPSLPDFLMKAGGVKEFQGEMKALGLDRVSKPFVGRLVRADGLPLDEARRLAAENGFFDHLYGTPDEAMARSTVNDLLDALDAQARGQQTARADDGGRVAAERLVTEMVELAGPGIDDALIARAVEIANAEGVPALDALDRVLMAEDQAQWAAETAMRADTGARPLNGIEERGGLSDPAMLDDDMMLSPGDLADLPEDFDIPFFDDGRMASPAEVAAEIDHIDKLFDLVEACRA